ncbi:MAG: integrase core domain-containing protein [Henriciella sp.]
MLGLSSQASRPHLAMRQYKCASSTLLAKIRHECLYAEVFDSLAHARSILVRWRHAYNDIRPHSSLGGLMPAAHRSLELDGSIAPDALAKPQTMGSEHKKAILSL